jgi:predicted transcriptional regulator
MTTDTSDLEMLIRPNDVCALLNIKESTLRKYALILKDAGYQFHVNDKGQRGYFNKDVIMKESQEAQKLLLEVQEERKQRKGFMRWFSKD